MNPYGLFFVSLSQIPDRIQHELQRFRQSVGQQRQQCLLLAFGNPLRQTRREVSRRNPAIARRSIEKHMTKTCSWGSAPWDEKVVP